MQREILQSDYDSYNNEHYGMPCGLYFYFVNKNLPNFSYKETSIIGNCPAIQTVQFVPFITESDLGLFQIPYDIERFGKINNMTTQLSEYPNVFRINNLAVNIKELGRFTTYKVNNNVGGSLSYFNESRLYNYPFSFAMITDNLNTPIEIKYHLCKSNESVIKVRNTISDRCSYGIYIENYKGDKEGKMESMVSGDAHELPCSSSAYNQWYASNKNQVAQGTQAVMQNSFLTKQTNGQMLIPNMIGNLTGMNMNPASWIGAGANSIGTAVQYNATNKRADLDIQQNIQNKMAQTKDMLSTPNTMLSMGSDVYYGLEKGGKKVNLIRFGLHNEQLKKLGDYFAMFGYKQNKVLTPNIRNRYYYNYIKTVGINIKSSWIPRNHLEELKSIFDNGTTIWHIDRAGVVVGDISNDNYEI